MIAKKASKKVIAKKSYGGDDIKRYIDLAKDQFGKESHRHMSALAEEFQHRTSAIAEQFGGLNKKIDVINVKLDEHGRKLDEHGRILDSHTQMIGKLMTDMTEVKKDVQEIKTDLKQKVDRAEFARLEKRVIAIEAREYAGKPTR